MNNTNKLAIEALRKQIQRIAFDANLWDRGIADYPHAEHCSQKRKQLQAAIAELEGGPTQRAADKRILSRSSRC